MNRTLLDLIEKALGVPLEEVEHLDLTWPRESGLLRLKLEVSGGTSLHLSSNVGHLEEELPALLRAARTALERLPGPGWSLWIELVRTHRDSRLHLRAERQDWGHSFLVLRGGVIHERTGPLGAVEAALLGAAKAFYDEAKE